MACLKSLTSSTNQPYRKAHSFSEDMSMTPMEQQTFTYNNYNCLSGNPYSSPFSSYQLKLDTVPLLPYLKPTKSSRDLYDCESCHPEIDMMDMLQNLKNCVDIMNIMPVAENSNFVLSDLAFKEMPSCTQALLDKTTTSKPVNPPPVVNNSSNPASSTISSTCNSTVFTEIMQGGQRESSEAPSSMEDSNTAFCSDSNGTEEGNQYQSKCSSSNTQDCKKVMQSKPMMRDNTNQSALKAILNLTSVLSAPRKTVKKGRPSPKKQKKRQREKQKHALQPLQTTETLDSTHTGCDREQKCNSQSTVLLFNQSNEIDISSNSPCNRKFETAHKVLKQSCPSTHLFVRLMSCSEDENSIEDDDDQCKNDDSLNKNKDVPFSPFKGFGFSCALDLDTIFKKTIPQDLINTEKKKDYAFDNKNGFQKNTFQSSSQSDRFKKRNTTSTLPVLKDADSSFFTPVPSLDISLCKKPTSGSHAAVDRKESTCDVLTDGSTDHLPTSSEADSETLDKINAFWNESYPSAGFRNCSSVSTDEIKHPTIKVHFAAEPHFLTVHIVGTEERNGDWHHVIREREHFEKRIQELEQILSPFLEVNHRAKILEQRIGQEQQ